MSANPPWNFCLLQVNTHWVTLTTPITGNHSTPSDLLFVSLARIQLLSCHGRQHDAFEPHGSLQDQAEWGKVWVKPKVAVKTADRQISVPWQWGYGANWITREESNMTVSARAPSRLAEPKPLQNLLCSNFCLCKATLSHFCLLCFFAFMARMAGESITHLSWWVSRGGISGHIKVIITVGKYKIQKRRNWLDETCIPHLVLSFLCHETVLEAQRSYIKGACREAFICDPQVFPSQCSFLTALLTCPHT